MKIDVSIVIVSWNTKEMLRSTLSSLYKTIHTVSYEIIVVDNDSSDGSPEMVIEEFPNVKLIKTGANLGFARANNIGIEISCGQYVCLVNSDVEVFEHTVDLMCDYMDKHHDIGMLGPRTLNSDKTLQTSFGGFPTYWRLFCRAFSLDRLFPRSPLFAGLLMSYFNGDKTRPVDMLYGCFWLIRKDALDDVGLLDEHYFMYAEDKDWCKRFAYAGWGVVYYSDVEIIHYGGASSASAPIKYDVEMLRANIQYWHKHHGKVGVVYFHIIKLLTNIASGLIWLLLHHIRPKTQFAKYKSDRDFAGAKFLISIASKFVHRLLKLGVSLVWYVVRLILRTFLSVLRMQQSSVVVLSYDAVTEDNRKRFIRQMNDLCKAGIPISSFLDNDIEKGKRYVAVTFDGGYQTLLTNALPILAQLKIPSTIFFATSYIGTLPGWITDFHNPCRLERIMTRSEIKSLSKDLITIGSCGHTGKLLTNLTTENIEYELSESKRILTDIIGHEALPLSFSCNCINDEVSEIANTLGYKNIFNSFSSNQNISKKKKMPIIRRVYCKPDDWFIEFYLKARGAYQW